MARRSSALTVLTLLSCSCYCRAVVSDYQTPLSLDRFYGQNQVDNVDNAENSNIDVSNQFHLHESSEWPFPNKIDNSIGQISGVSVSKDNLVYIFHRGDREWNQSTFFDNDVYKDKSHGPISSQAVVVLDSRNGSVIRKWGSNRFYMPHGITVDHENNVWLTDVALHQVFKFGPNSESCSENLLMTLGTAFEPGNDLSKFCKPTSVAVATNGEFYVADGYCNSRIVKFSADGRVLLQWGRSTKVSGDMPLPPYQLWIPHALTLAEDKNLICVADRENGRVLCFDINNGTFKFEINTQLFQRIFSVAYSPIADGVFYVLNDKNMDITTEILSQGIVINATSLEVIGRFHPNGNEFVRPHDMAVSPDGSSVYIVELIRSHIRKFELDSDTQNLYINKSLPPFHFLQNEVTYEFDKMKYYHGLDKDTGIQILILILLIAGCVFFAAAIIVTVLILEKTVFMAHKKNATYGRWHPRTLNVDGFPLGNIFNKKQRAGFEKLATVEVSEDDDDDDDGNDLTVKA